MINEVQSRYTNESKSCSNLSCCLNIALLEIVPGENILDLGCGRGLETIEAAKLTAPNGIATGLDLTPAMIEVAKENALSLSVTNVDFVLGNIEALPFRDSSFDAVISNCVINHASDKFLVFREIFRVLKNGGRFIISDAVTKYPLPLEIKNDPKAVADCFGGVITESEYLESIKKSGFKYIEIIKEREYIKNGYDFKSITIKAFK